MLRRPTALLAARCAVVAALVTVPSVLAVPAGAQEEPAAPRPAGMAPQADFDCDGYADVAASAPGGSIAGRVRAGYITVVHGSASGADTGRRQVISQASAGVPGEPAADARFGFRTVARDLDGDGCTDLAVQASGTASAIVLWGSARGLSGGTALPAAAGTDGENLVGGDFNGDGHADLVGGSTLSEEWGDLRVLYGPFDRGGVPATTGGLSTGEVFEPRDLAAGDVTGDGKDDLVSLHDFEEMAKPTHFWRATADGFEPGADNIVSGDTATIGDVDGDGFGDLVLRTVPGGVVENLPYDEGTVRVVYGSAAGPGSRTTVISQGTAGVPGAGEEGDQFGDALDAGDVNADGYADIAVGVPYEDIAGGGADAGAVVLLKGGAKGLTGSGAQAFHQHTSGVPGVAEAGDRFGAALSLLDTDADGRDDLAAGAPGEDGTTLDTGAGWVLRGADGGLTTAGVVSYGPGALGAPEAGARLGDAYSR